MSEVRIRRTYNLSVGAQALWPILSDTNRMNRMFGLPAVRFMVDKPEGARRPSITGHATELGQELRWQEHPFEWVEGQRFSVLRTYDRGPFEQVRNAFELRAVDAERSQVDIEMVATPRSAVAGMLLRVGQGTVARKWGQILEQMAAQARGTAVDAEFPAGFAPDPMVVMAAGTMRAELLRMGFTAPVVDGLIAYVAGRPEYDLTRIRPYALAPLLGVARLQALRLCLAATRVGLLSMSWDLLCPHCRGAKQRTDTLTGVTPTGGCDTCGIQFDVEFDRNVEVTFRPAAAVRKVDAESFCFGGPALTPHVRVQQELAGGESRELDVVLATGRYRLRAVGVPGSSLLEVGMHADGTPLPSGEGAAEVQISVDPVSVSATPVSGLGNTLRLKLSNLGSEPALLVLETSAWIDEAATGAAVVSLQDFRDLFGKEVLQAGQNIRVGQVTLMFTDLKGSTALYEELGDVRAYALVQEHFRMLFDVIRHQEGAVVKTIGDAVMAVFDRPVQALQCALEVQRRAAQLKGDDGREVVIKIGLHCGPCLAVGQNEKLDYFGNMVNVAARAQNESVGWDVVITGAILKDGPAAMIAGDVEREVFQARLKGLREATELTRLWPLGVREAAPVRDAPMAGRVGEG